MGKRPGAAGAGGPAKASKESRPWVEHVAEHSRKLGSFRICSVSWESLSYQSSIASPYEKLRIGFDLSLGEHPVKNLMEYMHSGSIYEPLQTWLGGLDPSFPVPEMTKYPVARLNK